MKNISELELLLLEQTINLTKFQISFAKEYTKEQMTADLDSLLAMVRSMKEEEK